MASICNSFKGNLYAWSRGGRNGTLDLGDRDIKGARALGNGDGTRDANWAREWQDARREGKDWYVCRSAHSQPLNANLETYAAWWLWARLAGWSGR